MNEQKKYETYKNVYYENSYKCMTEAEETVKDEEIKKQEQY